MRIDPQYTGKWRLAEMSMWDQDYIDMVAPGYIAIKRNGIGTMAFGVVEAGVDCRMEKSGAGFGVSVNAVNLAHKSLLSGWLGSPA